MTTHPGRRARRLVTAIALAAGSTALALGLGRIPFFQTLDWKLYDQHVRWAADPSAARKDIVVVRIDESSIRHLAPVVGRWPWPRLVHGSVVDFLARAPARVVAYDVLFTEADQSKGITIDDESVTGSESDAAFAESVAHAGNVIVLADATFEGTAAESTGTAETARDAAAKPMKDEGATSSAGRPDVGPQPGSPSAQAAYEPEGEPATPAPVEAQESNQGEQAEQATSAAEAFPKAPPDWFEPRPNLLLPYPELADAARAIGHNYLVVDPDGPVRRSVPFLWHEGHLVPSLGMAAFELAERIEDAPQLEGDVLLVGDRRVPLLREMLPRFADAPATEPAASSRRLLIDYRGPAVLSDGKTTTYREYSFYDLFYSEQQLLAGEKPLVDPADLRNAIVFVGVTAAGLHDVFAVPFGEGSGKMTGPQIHASVTDQLMAGRFVRPASWLAIALATIACALLGALALTLASVRLGTILLVVGLVLLLSLSARVFGHGVWMPEVQPLLAALMASVGGLAYQYFVEGREKREVKRLFSRYLSKDVYEQVLENPSLAELGGKRRDMSVLFSDIRGFTPMTEKGDPEWLVAQLNEYFSRMVEIVFAHRGTVDKFVGDMIMALFGAPLDDEEHADHAVQAALAMVAELERLNTEWTRQGRPRLGIGIGINSGEMIAGNIGAESIRSYTVIGDNVNLGSRLESLNKEYGTSIIISEYTVSRLKGRYDLRFLGEVVVKGKSRAVGVHEVRPAEKEPGH